MEVTGTGYDSKGIFQDSNGQVNPSADPSLALLLRIGMLCNDAKVERTGEQETILGDPTEAALLVVAEKAGMNQKDLALEYPRLSEVPFDSTSKWMVTVHRTLQGSLLAYVKGAPGAVLEASTSQWRASAAVPFTSKDRQHWNGLNEELAGRALRVLALAYRELPPDFSEDDVTQQWIFVGLVGMSDPLREEAKAAIATCREAGIRTVMITGDQPSTASELARQLGN